LSAALVVAGALRVVAAGRVELAGLGGTTVSAGGVKSSANTRHSRVFASWMQPIRNSACELPD
jgi:hypothetical protein